MSTYYVAWWNLENLFDEENAPPERRSDKVRRAIGKDIVGWTPQLRDRKVAQLASVLARMNAGTGPDVQVTVPCRAQVDALTDPRPGLVGHRALTSSSSW
jgi:hypothetical protein